MGAVERQTRHIQSRRQRGLCAYGGCPVYTGRVTYHCVKHAEVHAIHARLSRKKEKPVGQ